MARSIGSEKFSNIPGRPSQVALKLSTTLPNISKWAGGRQKPLGPMRELIKATWPDEAPEPAEWDIPLVAEESEEDESEPPEIPLERATPQAVEGEADELLKMLRQARLEAATKTDVGERLQLIAQSAQAMLALGKISGAGLNLTEAKILASPQWRNIEAMLTLALEPWPEAMRAVADTLKRLAGITGPLEAGRTE